MNAPTATIAIELKPLPIAVKTKDDTMAGSGAIAGALISVLIASLAIGSSPASAAIKARNHSGGASWLAPILVDDEAVAVTEHCIRTAAGPLVYEARAGRIAIRDDATGELRGRIFFVAYVVKTSGKPRPITFAWNGGPLVASTIVHMEGLGPRLRAPHGLVDNPDTPLAVSDLVFMDAVETGFSRPAKPEFAQEFMNLQGDVGATAEFIRAYRDRFRANDQPLYLVGESYGVFRAAAVADRLTATHQKLDGVILVSGDIPNIAQSSAFYDAMHVPARTATAFYYRRLDPDLMRERGATLRAATDWARTVYLPALEARDRLTTDQRETIARDLARYTGLRPEQVDRMTLVVHVDEYLSHFLDETGNKVMTEEDTRLLVGEPGDDLGDLKLVDGYIRGDLGYSTDLTYNGIERGYTPFPMGRRLSIHDQWSYNQPGVTPAVMAEFASSGEVSPLARVNPPWIVEALKQDKALQVLVATGRYDPLSMCEGDAIVAGELPAGLSARLTTKCYESGHVIYRDPAARPVFLHDISAFIQATAAVER